MARPKRDPTKQVADLEGDVAALERVALAAEEAQQFSPAIQARSRLPSLRTELNRLRDLEDLGDVTDPLERVRLTRRIAEREGSWQAVARLASVEADLEVRLAEARAQEEAAKLSALTADDLVGMIEEAFSSLPANTRSTVLARLAG